MAFETDNKQKQMNKQKIIGQIVDQKNELLINIDLVVKVDDRIVRLRTHNVHQCPW